MNIIWIGIDDTDSRNGGCTTYTALVLIRKLIDKNYDIIGYPKLVRLNPNIPWKTRGNGAISIGIGKGVGEKIIIGSIDKKEIFCFSKRLANCLNKHKIRDIIEDVLEENARLEDDDTNSGIVILDEKPSFDVYKKTVREIVKLQETKKILDSKNAEYKGYKNGRGLIGATASVAWYPKDDKTYELITYREKEKWGSQRFVDDESSKKMDKILKKTFDNYDYENKHNRLVPSSPCPVLYGIRGEDDKELLKAKSAINSEKIYGWLLFGTNQGTDDHLQKKKISKIKAYDSVITKGVVCKNPDSIKGGHVIFTIEDSTGKIDCAAYEPTKQFRNVIRELIVGDVVEVYGGIREKPLTINIEKINVTHLEKQIEKVENPVCPKCGKHMKSKGAGQGYKCKMCGITSNKPTMKERKRNIKAGFYEVPICARRHLSKPLKRMT